MLNGYDISNNQGNIDNTQVPGDAVIIKATEGIGYTDPDCDANYQQSKGAGKLLGVYHFARPDGNPNGADEAGWFYSQIQGYIGEAIPVLDLEVNPRVEWAKAFLDRFYELSQVRPWLYMSKSTAESQDWSSVWGDYSLWVADYGLNMPQNGYTPSQAISVNGNWTIAGWQYTSQGHLPGWGGALDLDVFYMNADGWKKYAAKEVPPAPTPQPVVQPTPVTTPAPVQQPAPIAQPISVPVSNPVPTPQPAPASSEPQTLDTNHIPVSIVRTVVPYMVGWIVSLLTMLTITVPASMQVSLTNMITFVVGTVWYIVVRLLEKKWPALGFLLGIPSQPTYNN